MSSKESVSKQKQYKSSSVCKGLKQAVIYAWAMDAPKLTLPLDVAFKIGQETDVKYLVLQVHYAQTDMFESELSVLSTSFSILFQ